MKDWFIDFIKFYMFRNAVWKFITMIVIIGSMSWLSFILFISNITEKPNWINDNFTKTDTKYTFVTNSQTKDKEQLLYLSNKIVKIQLEKIVQEYIRDNDILILGEAKVEQIKQKANELVDNFSLKNITEISNYKEDGKYYILTAIETIEFDYQKDKLLKNLSDFIMSLQNDEK